jgi:membrane protease YdiL (CAAX protease family)
MALVGGLAGGVFAGLFLWRGGLLAPFVAHLTLNSIEFIFASRLA